MSKLGDAFFGELRSYLGQGEDRLSYDHWLSLKLQEAKLPNLDEYLSRHVPYLIAHPQFEWPEINACVVGPYRPYHLPFVTKISTRFSQQWHDAFKHPCWKDILANVSEAQHLTNHDVSHLESCARLNQELLWEVNAHTLREMVMRLGSFSIKHLKFSDNRLVYHPHYQDLGWKTLERVTILSNYPIYHHFLREWSYLKIPHTIHTLCLQCHSTGHAFDALRNLHEMTLQADAFFEHVRFDVWATHENRRYQYAHTFDASDYYDKAFVWLNSLESQIDTDSYADWLASFLARIN